MIQWKMRRRKRKETHSLWFVYFVVISIASNISSEWTDLVAVTHTHTQIFIEKKFLVMAKRLAHIFFLLSPDSRSTESFHSNPYDWCSITKINKYLIKPNGGVEMSNKRQKEEKIIANKFLRHRNCRRWYEAVDTIHNLK